MQTQVDAQLYEEANTFRLRFACPDCVHFEADARACSQGFPSEPHQNPDLVGRELVVFCKLFELY